MAIARLVLVLAALVVAVSAYGFPWDPYCTYATADSRYIGYYGTVTARYWHDSFCCGQASHSGSCSAEGTGLPQPDNNTFLYVGKNPDWWDSSPWFFELYHLTYDRNFSYVTSDELIELDFASTVRTCYGDEASACYWRTNYTEQKLDLTKAEVSLAEADGTYTVTGDSGVWTGGGGASYEPGVTIVRSSCDYLDDNHDLHTTVTFVDFHWQSGINFTFSLSFSMDSASLDITTFVNGSRMELQFTGARSEADSSPIELDTSDGALPQFKNVNGSALWPETSSSTTSGLTARSSVSQTATGVATSSSSAAAEPQHGGSADMGSMAGSVLLGLLTVLLG